MLADCDPGVMCFLRNSSGRYDPRETVFMKGFYRTDHRELIVSIVVFFGSNYYVVGFVWMGLRPSLLFLNVLVFFWVDYLMNFKVL